MSDGSWLFVSHVHEDRAVALEIVAELERRDLKCWIAPRDVTPGKFDDVIADAIDRCLAFLLIFSERCNDNEYISRELTVAGDAHKQVIPLRIEEAEPKRGLRIRLANLHRYDAFPTRNAAIDELVGRLKPAPTAGRTPGSPPPPPDPPPRIPTWIPLVAVAALIVILVVAWSWPSPITKPEYQVTIWFAGLNREMDIVPLSSQLRAFGWNAQDPQPPRGNDRTGKAAGLREVRYSSPADLPAAELLVDDLRKAGVASAPVKTVKNSDVAPGNLQLWIGTPIDLDWKKSPPDKAHCYQRDAMIEGNQFLVRCHRTMELCKKQRRFDAEKWESAKLTDCVWSTGLLAFTEWGGAEVGNDEWWVAKHPDKSFPPPFPQFSSR